MIYYIKNANSAKFVKNYTKLDNRIALLQKICYTVNEAKRRCFPIKQLSSNIADFYVKRSIIKENEKEVYQYGIELILNDVITFGIILLSSALIWKFRYAIEFLVVFCFTRVYCGGYHASKAYICRATMLTIFLCIYLLTNEIMQLNPLLLCWLFPINLAIMIVLVPVRHPNKKLTDEQIRKNRKAGILLYLFFAIVSIILTIFVSKIDGIIIWLSLCSVTALAIIGTLTNERWCNYEKDN